MSIGSLIGGHLIEYVGGAKTFQIFSIGAFVLCISHSIVQCIIKKKLGPYGKNSTANGEDDSVTKSIEPLEVKNRDDITGEEFKS